MRAEAIEPPDPLAGEVWATPTAVVGSVGSKTVRAAFGQGVEDTGSPPNSSATAGRLVVATTPARGLELALLSTVITVDNPDRGPLDLGVNARWSLVPAGKLHVAALGSVHFGGIYVAEHSNRRDFGGGVGFGTTYCTRSDCSGLVSFTGSLDGHDITHRADFSSDGFRTLRGGVALGIGQPLTSRFAVFATGSAQFGLTCARVYGDSIRCPDGTVLGATVGGRVWWRWGALETSRLALDLGLSVLHLPSSQGLVARTAILGGAMLSLAWGGSGPVPS